MTIGELARRAGCTVPTVRFYESVGLIPPAARTTNGRRSYGWPDLSQLTFIRRARDFGLPIEQVRELIAADRAARSECEPARSIIARRLEEVRAKQSELDRLQSSLEQMLARCDPDCCAVIKECTILSHVGARDAFGS